MAKDYYSILGVSKSASQAEIKAAYRKLSKETHPDKHKGDKQKEDQFKQINEAYDVLGDGKKKQAYDQFGSTNGNPFGGGGGGGGGFGGFDGFDASQFSGGFGDIFENFFGGAASGASRSRERDTGGRDIEIQIIIPFQTAVSGEDREVKFSTEVSCDTCSGSGTEPGSKQITCPECTGTGQIVRRVNSLFGTIQQSSICPKCRGSGKIPEKACHTCHGEGRVQKQKTVKVHIPAGISDGQALRITSQGEAGRQGGKAGDLYVRIRVEADARFERIDDDIRTSVSISAVDAILGTSIDVPTVHGEVSLTIPAGTQPDQILRMKSKGMPILNTSRHGDHYVTVKVEIPTKLSKKEKELMEEWRKAR